MSNIGATGGAKRGFIWSEVFNFFWLKLKCISETLYSKSYSAAKALSLLDQGGKREFHQLQLLQILSLCVLDTKNVHLLIKG